MRQKKSLKLKYDESFKTKLLETFQEAYNPTYHPTVPRPRTAPLRKMVSEVFTLMLSESESYEV